MRAFCTVESFPLKKLDGVDEALPLPLLSKRLSLLDWIDKTRLCSAYAARTHHKLVQALASENFAQSAQVVHLEQTS